LSRRITEEFGVSMSVSITMLGHAGVQISGGGKIIYIDAFPKGVTIDLSKFTKPFENADIILVTHSHDDHCNPSKIETVRRDDTIVIAPADCVPKIGGNVQTLKPGEEQTIDNIIIRAVEAYNIKRFRSPGQPFHPKGFGVGYIVTVEGKSIYHAGDTDFIQEMKELGSIDVALLPVGGTYTMDNDDGADAAIAIAPKVAIGMHTWDKSVEEFKRKVEANSNVKVVVLEAGGQYTIS
jgi:L-ascorbate metabolism protein UlaG (beta-lactamase superfamily)